VYIHGRWFLAVYIHGRWFLAVYIHGRWFLAAYIHGRWLLTAYIHGIRTQAVTVAVSWTATREADGWGAEAAPMAPRLARTRAGATILCAN